MASSEVAICNLALNRARSARKVESFRGQGDGSAEAEILSVEYDDTRDDALSRADWGFARKRLILNQVGTPPPEWGYSYQLPADCIRALGVQDGARVRTFAQGIRYAIENDGTGSGRVILMDVTDAVLVYTMRAKDPTIYSPAFVKAFSWLLAANIARPLDKSLDACREILQIAEALIGRAAAMDYNEQKPDPQPDSDFFTSRIA